ncbi:MAG: hypothetical protein H0W63_12050 [Gemmatimonadaceae bacterium]|nr:hypothetical protein [Gemmatimonadaceae bacterium]
MTSIGVPKVVTVLKNASSPSSQRRRRGTTDLVGRGRGVRSRIGSELVCEGLHREVAGGRNLPVSVVK